MPTSGSKRYFIWFHPRLWMSYTTKWLNKRLNNKRYVMTYKRSILHQTGKSGICSIINHPHHWHFVLQQPFLRGQPSRTWVICIIARNWVITIVKKYIARTEERLCVYVATWMDEWIYIHTHSLLELDRLLLKHYRLQQWIQRIELLTRTFCVNPKILLTAPLIQYV